jgi:hypothetical protein
MFKKRCYNGGTKHKFLPRYTEQPTGQAIKSTGGFYGTMVDHSTYINDLRKLTILKVYVCDICEWCGARADKDTSGKG